VALFQAKSLSSARVEKREVQPLPGRGTAPGDADVGLITSERAMNVTRAHKASSVPLNPEIVSNAAAL